MSVISSARALPCNLLDEKQKSYLLIPGEIMNNVNYPDVGPDAPLLLGCPEPVSSDPDCDKKNCEIRLHPTRLTWCGQDAFGEMPSTYYLPSLAFAIKNNINGSKKIISPYDAVETLTTSSESMVDFGGYTCGSEIISCGDPNDPDTLKLDVRLQPDGILSAVYTFSLYNSYQDEHKRTVYDYVICPYAPTNIFELPNPCASPVPPVPPFVGVQEIMGTQPFCLGTPEQPCVCVSLLLHGALKENPDPSFIGCTQTSLYWVGVKLYYTNIQGQMCINNPVCLNITHVPDSVYENCFTPYFAKTTSVVVPIGSIPPQCGQSENTNCPTPLHISPGEEIPKGSLHGTVYLGCGQEGEKLDGCSEGELEIISVSSKIDVNDVVSADPCSVYIVLIPNIPETLVE